MPKFVATPEYHEALHRFLDLLAPRRRSGRGSSHGSGALASYTETGRKYDRIHVLDGSSGQGAVRFFIDRSTGAIYGTKSAQAPNPKRYYGTIYTADKWDWSSDPPVNISDDSVIPVGSYGGHTHYAPAGGTPKSDDGSRPIKTERGASAEAPSLDDDHDVKESVFHQYMNTPLRQPPRDGGRRSERERRNHKQSPAFPPPIPNSYWLPGGRVAAGEYPGAKSESEAREKIGRLLDAGIRSFVDLTVPADRLDPYEPLLKGIAAERTTTVTYRHMGYRDNSAPTPGEMTRILEYIESEVDAMRPVYVHCWGGIGRTGTVVGCYLARSGYESAVALDMVGSLFKTMSPEKVRRHPEGSPQTPAQCRMVREWREERRDTSERRRPYPSPSLRRRFRGCMLGGAVGDALGAPVEFLKLTEIRRRYGPNGITEPERAGSGVYEITDDTQMTLFTAEGILRGTHRAIDRGGYGEPFRPGGHPNLAYVAYHAYLRWLRTQGERGPDVSVVRDYPGWLIDVADLHSRRAPGNTCLSALRSGRIGSRREPLNDSKGCGGVMRVAPAGLIDTEDPFAYGADLAAITHGHPTGYLAAGAFATIIHHVTRGTTLVDAVTSALERLNREPSHEETTRALKDALRLWREQSPVDDAIAHVGGGWIAEEALAIAVYCALMAGNDFARGVCLAVNHSGDSDSTGAIAGNILGAMLGVEAIPARWLEHLELREVITTLADDLLTGYHNSDLWRERYPPN